MQKQMKMAVGMEGRGFRSVCALLLSLLIGGLAHAQDPRYVIRSGEVYDKKTDLTWQRCSVGQRWSGENGCVGIVKTFTFDDAQKQGGGGWRVPSKDELATLIKNQNGLQIDTKAFPDIDDRKVVYWSSTPSSSTSNWYVHFTFGNGGVHYDNRSFAYALRLVRDGQ